MKLYLRIILAFGFCLGLGFFYSYKSILDELRPRYLESVEEVLVDEAHLLAEWVSQNSKDSLNTEALKKAVNFAHRRRFSAKIYDLKKEKISVDVYVTDKNGIVVFHSWDPKKVGQDYSNWRDVTLTLQGKYGARSSDRMWKDPSSSTLYVSAPILKQGRVIGVLTVCKPTTTINYFVNLARPKMIRSGLFIAFGILCIAALITLWINRPIGKLVEYASRIRDGQNPPLPNLNIPEVKEMGKAIQEMKEALEGKEYVEDYTHTLTHEIKSPLSSILGAAELLQEEVPPERQKRFLQNIYQESKRIQNLVDRMLELAQLENRKDQDTWQDVNLSILLQEILNNSLIETKNIHLEKNIKEIVVLGDAFLLRQAVSNLLQNALEFSPHDATLQCSLLEEGNNVEITFEDEGGGIPDYALSKVFDKFFSLPRVEGGKKSTGLGLSFVKKVAELHHGFVQLTNVKNGLKVIFSIQKRT